MLLAGNGADQARYKYVIDKVVVFVQWDRTRSIGIIAALMWSAAQPYLMVSSLFPATASKAGWVLLLLAVVMVVSAMLPGSQKRTGENTGAKAPDSNQG